MPTPVSTVLRTAEVAGWDQLDPHVTASESFFHYFGSVYSGLLRWETGPDTPFPVRRVVPDLAEGWEQPDSRTYRFRLRPNARWHDLPPAEGRRVVAEDVAFSVRRLLSRESAHQPLWTKVGGVRAMGDDIVEITLTEPYPPFLFQLASGFNVVVAPEAVAEGGGSVRQGPVVGTGPFLFDAKASHRQSIGVFLRNPAFYQDGAPRTDRLERLVVGSEEASVALLRAGRLDFVAVSARSAQDFIDGGAPGLRAASQPALAGWALSSSARSPFDRREVRQALSLAVDRTALWQTFSESRLPLAVGLGMPLPAREAMLADAEIAPYFRYDPAEARRLLERAGVAPRTPVIVTMGDFGPSSVAAGLLLVRQLQEVGWNAEPYVRPPGTYAALTLPPGSGFQIAFGPVAAPEETDLWLSMRFETGGALNAGGFADSELDRLIQTQRLEADSSARVAVLRQAQDHLLRQAYQPVVFLDQKWMIRREGLEGWPSFQDEPFQRFLRDVGRSGR